MYLTRKMYDKTYKRRLHLHSKKVWNVMFVFPFYSFYIFIGSTGYIIIFFPKWRSRLHVARLFKHNDSFSFFNTQISNPFPSFSNISVVIEWIHNGYIYFFQPLLISFKLKFVFKELALWNQLLAVILLFQIK